MSNSVAIGVDIGGSHISSAAVDLKRLKIIPETTFSIKVNNKAGKEAVFKNWAEAINETIKTIPIQEKINIGFAMPGPFHYKTGLAMFKDNDKYENLYNVYIPDGLAKHINATKMKMRFLNDATSFGVGVAAIGKAKNFSKIIVVTLGTGFGSAFIKDGVPVVEANNVPLNGCLWDKPYKQGIGDDYFSTRWCVNRYQELSSVKVNGVREIAEANNEHAVKVFKEFGSNMAEFMIPFLRQFNPGLVVLGGNVSNASQFFLPTLEDKIKVARLKVNFEISDLMEDAAMIGSARLFEANFWNSVKNELPNL